MPAKWMPGPLPAGISTDAIDMSDVPSARDHRVKKDSYTALEQEIESSFVARKRLFIGLITGTSFLLCILLVFFWVVPFVGLKSIHPLAPWILGMAVAVAIFFIAWSSLALVLNILGFRPFFLSRRLRGLTIKIFLPLMTMFGRTLGIPKQKIQASFIKVNNELVQRENKQYRPEEILLLMPHCLQNSRCKIRLTYDIQNCKRCGLCPIAGLLDLSDRYGVHLAVATGGTIARRIVVQNRPKFILAVACERDLSSGIQDTYPLPVYGVLNRRPHGPCLDTTVPLEHLEWALNRFLAPEFRRSTGEKSA
jgi:hypothetical protein